MTFAIFGISVLIDKGNKPLNIQLNSAKFS